MYKMLLMNFDDQNLVFLMRRCEDEVSGPVCVSLLPVIFRDLNDTIFCAAIYHESYRILFVIFKTNFTEK